jgi:hypothetical protein
VEPAPAPPTPAPAPTPDSGGNTTVGNSGGITTPPTPTPTPAPPPAPPATIVWNWTWNCQDPPPPPPVDLSTIDPQTTTIILNWNWDCPDAPPPSVQQTTVTACVGCNINISVRVASPGDNGDVNQSTQVDVTSIATTVSEATQAATQTVVPPQPPVVSPPAPPQTSNLTVAAATPAPALPAQPTPPALIPPVSPVPDLLAGEAPRHGAPDFATAQRAAAPATVDPRPAPLRRVAVRTVVHTISVVHVRTVVRSQTHAARVARPTRPSLPFPPAPSPSLPGTVAPVLSESHATGGFTPVALALGGIGTFLLMFLAYAAPGLQTVRSRPAQARPHPPG